MAHQGYNLEGHGLSSPGLVGRRVAARPAIEQAAEGQAPSITTNSVLRNAIDGCVLTENQPTTV
jgi:hypothetical protein